jgi:single-stranded-DNA-specific exonuclease
MEAMRRKPQLGEGLHPDDWLDLVAIGTVADIAPLRGENRRLVQRGLFRLNRPQRPGLLALYNEAGIKPGRVSAMTIGFVIGPRINAAGRLRSALLAYDLLSAPDAMRAAPLARQLNEINRERQDKTLQMQQWAEEMLDASPDDEPLLFAYDPRFEQGVVGLVASRLTEQYYRPSVVLQQGDEESHGSCRSIPEFHITHALEQCEDLLERFGGHAAAAGFTVANHNIEELGERLWQIAAEELADKELVAVLQVDTELPLSEATMELADALNVLEPTGEANEPPVFVTRRAEILERSPVGSEQQHLKLRLRNNDGVVEAIAFRWGDYIDLLPDVIDVAYNLEINEWNSRRSVQLNVRDIRTANGA